MIYLSKEEFTEDHFVSLLEQTKNGIIATFKDKDPKGINGTSFEDSVYKQMLLSAKGSSFNGHIIKTGAHAFPDIVARDVFGVEVKMTIGDKWISTGNSVLESTRIDKVDTIYMFFGKFGTEFDVKYRKYQECLYEIGVTHSPRYKIDMNLPEGESIFAKLGVEYNNFRKEDNPIKRLKTYYKAQLKKGQDLWWLDNNPEERVVSPVIQSFVDLDKEIKERFMVQSFILFPEVFSENKRSKFNRPASYMITEYNSVSSSLRDIFTAGGKVHILFDDKIIKVSRIVYNFSEKAKAIHKFIYTIPKETLNYYWGVAIDDDPLKIWKKLLLDNSNEDIDIVAVFDEFISRG